MNKACDATLKRLQTDRIDLYQSHRDDKEVPLEETLAAYAALIEAGKVRAIGASNYEAPRLKEALDLSEKSGLPRYESLQPLYNLVDRAAFEKDLEPLCTARGVGVIGFYGLAKGFLTGKYRSEADLAKSPRGAGVKDYLGPRGMKTLRAVDEVAEARKATPAQVALAWLMARPSVTAPIASATSLAQLDELIAAAKLTLTPADVARLNAASQP